MPSSSANAREEVGISSIGFFSQTVEMDARDIFHSLGSAYFCAMQQTVEMTTDKNGGPNHLRAWRSSKGMTLEELGEKVGTSASVIGYLESGERALSAKWLRRLAPALGTTPGFLLDHSPEAIDAEIFDMWAHAPQPVRKQIAAVVRVMAKGGTPAA